MFFKLRPDVITEDNLHSNVLVSSMLDSPINTLYQAVHQVFAPILLKVGATFRIFFLQNVNSAYKNMHANLS